MGCSVFRRTRRASVGGHVEHPSEVNNSTSTGLRMAGVADSCGGRGESTAAFRSVTAERATSTAAAGHLILVSSFTGAERPRSHSAEFPSGMAWSKEGYNKPELCPPKSIRPPGTRAIQFRCEHESRDGHEHLFGHGHPTRREAAK